MDINVKMPDAINRQQILDLVGAIGFDPNDVVRLAFRPDGVMAVVADRDEQGRRRLDVRRGECATIHRLIPIVDEEQGQ